MKHRQPRLQRPGLSRAPYVAAALWLLAVAWAVAEAGKMEGPSAGWASVGHRPQAPGISFPLLWGLADLGGSSGHQAFTWLLAALGVVALSVAAAHLGAASTEVFLAVTPLVSAALVLSMLRGGELVSGLPMVVLGLVLANHRLGSTSKRSLVGLGLLWQAPALGLVTSLLLLACGMRRRAVSGLLLGAVTWVVPAVLVSRTFDLAPWLRSSLLLEWPASSEPWIGAARLLPRIDRTPEVRWLVAALFVSAGALLVRHVSHRLDDLRSDADARAVALPLLLVLTPLVAVPNALPTSATMIVPLVAMWIAYLDSRLIPGPVLPLAFATAGAFVAVVDGAATSSAGARSLAWVVAGVHLLAMVTTAIWLRQSPQRRASPPATSSHALVGARRADTWLAGKERGLSESTGMSDPSRSVTETVDVASSGPAATDGPTDEELKSSAVRGAAWLGVANIVAKGSQVLVTLALAAFLSPAQLGHFSLTNTVLQFAGLLQTMGLFDVIARTRRDADQMASVMTTVSVTIGCVLAAVGFVGADAIGSALGTPAVAPLLRIAMVGLPFSAYAGVQVALITRHLQFERRVISDGGSAIAGSVVTIVLAWLHWGAYGAVIGATVTALLLPVLAFAAGTRPSFGWDPSAAREAFGWAAVAGPGALVSVLLLNMDYVVTGRMLGDGPTGVYGLGYRIAFMPFVTVAVVLAGVAFPILAEVHRSGGGQRMSWAITQLVATSSALTAGVYAVLFAVADHVDLFGTKWTESTPVLRILCFYGFLLSCNLIPLDALRAAGHKGKFLGLQLIHFAVLLVALVTLTGAYGIVGTAVAQVAASGLIFVLAMGTLVRAEDVKVLPLIIALRGPLIAAVATLAYAYAFGAIWPHTGPSFAQGMVQGITSLLVYGAVLSLADRSLARAAVSRLRRR